MADSKRIAASVRGPATGLPRLSALMALCVMAPLSGRAEDATVDLAVEEQQIQIAIGGRPFARFRFQGEGIQRPYFCEVRAPNGRQVTRNHPPVDGQDATDHGTMHPGVWLAFGDLGGADFWRNKATVRCRPSAPATDAAASELESGSGIGRFTVLNRYESEAKLLCEETCRVTVQPRPLGYLLTLDSTFRATEDLYFGDQEEMGLGLRVATSMTVQQGGRILNSDGQTNEKQVWGQQADWCDYSGAVEGQPVGVTLMPHPENFRRSWFHARDYGLLVANPFGESAFTGGEKSKIMVGKGQEFRLRFGVLVHDGQPDGASAYQDYLDRSAKESAAGDEPRR